MLRFYIKMGVRVIIGKQRPLPFLSYRFYGNDLWIENHRSRFQWFLHATKEANSITISTLLPLLHTSRSSGITKVVPFLSSRGHKTHWTCVINLYRVYQIISNGKEPSLLFYDLRECSRKVLSLVFLNVLWPRDDKNDTFNVLYQYAFPRFTETMLQRQKKSMKRRVE